MPDDRSSFSLTKLIAAIIFGMGLLAASVVFGVNYAVDRAVSIDARTKADDWAKYFINTLPDLDRLLANGKLDERGHLVCPWHQSAYDVRTGRMLRGPQGAYAKVPGLGAAYRAGLAAVHAVRPDAGLFTLSEAAGRQRTLRVDASRHEELARVYAELASAQPSRQPRGRRARTGGQPKALPGGGFAG
jgi:hypothetical protein